MLFSKKIKHNKYLSAVNIIICFTFILANNAYLYASAPSDSYLRKPLDFDTSHNTQRYLSAIKTIATGAEYHAVQLDNVSVAPGTLFRDVIEHVTKNGQDEVIFSSKDNKKQLTIRRIEKDNNIYLAIGQRVYKVDESKIVNLSDMLLSDDPLLWIGNYDLVDFSGLTLSDILNTNFYRLLAEEEALPIPGVTAYLYDNLKDPISRLRESELVSPNPSIDALALAREGLKTQLAAGLNIYERLNNIAILAQSNITIEGISYQLAIEDRIMVTDHLEDIIRTAEDKTIDKTARELLFSISLLAIREKQPAKDNIFELSLTEKEKEDVSFKLEKKIPFVIESAEDSKKEFERLNDIFSKVVAEGEIQPYFIVNIQNFTPNTFLAYSEFLRGISRKYNGNATFLLSLQAPFVKIEGEEKLYKPFDHDMPGTYTSRRRAIDVFGKDFYLKEYIANISDGGEKTRAANAGVRYEHWSKVLTSKGISFLETNMLTAGTMWLLLPEHGKNMRLWLASDGSIQFGKINLGGNFLSNLPEDFQIAGCGPEVLVMTEEQREQLLKLTDIELSSEWSQIKTNIDRRSLETRGIFVTDAKGVMKKFLEKSSAREIAETAMKDGLGKVTENIFFLIERADVSYNLVTEINNTLTDDKDRFLARRPVSVFKTIFQGFLSEEDTPANRILKKHIKKIHGISYGEGNVVGDIAGLEQYFSMWESYLMAYESSKEHPMEDNIRRSEKVDIQYRGGKENIQYLLRNVEIEGNGILEIGEGVLIETSSIEVNGGKLIIPDRTKIIDSSLKGGKYVFHGESGVVMGVDFGPGELLDIKPDKPDKPIEMLNIYGDETLVQIDYKDGKKYLVRMINSLPYKGATIAEIAGGLSKWGTIQKEMGIEERITFEDTLDMKLPSVCKNKKEWLKLAQLVFSENISTEVLYDFKDHIITIKDIEYRQKIELVERLIYALTSSRFTSTNRSKISKDAKSIVEDNNRSEKDLLDAIRMAYRNRFNAQIEEVIKYVKYEQVKDLSYGEALYRVLVAMHPRLLDIKDISTWDKVKDAEFIDLGIYGGQLTAQRAKSDMDALGMQEKTSRLRSRLTKRPIDITTADIDIETYDKKPGIGTSLDEQKTTVEALGQNL